MKYSLGNKSQSKIFLKKLKKGVNEFEELYFQKSLIFSSY